jgi:hypothetical protein
VDLGAAANNAFDSVLFIGDNYIIGQIQTSTSSHNFFPEWVKLIDVRVYIDTSGLIIGYLPKDADNGLIFDWDEWDQSNPLLKTTLQEAMEATAQAAMGETISGIQLSWYDWAHPDATHIMAAVKSINSTQENLFVSIPSSVTVYGAPSYSFRPMREITVKGWKTAQLIQTWPGGQQTTPGASHLFTGPLTLEQNTMHTFSHDRTNAVFSDVGIVIVYAQ